jgi:hypothetical protein
MFILVVYFLLYFLSLYLMYRLLLVVINSYFKINKENLKCLRKVLYYRTIMLAPLIGIMLVLARFIILGTIIIVVLESVFIFFYYREKQIFLKNQKGG